MWSCGLSAGSGTFMLQGTVLLQPFSVKQTLGWTNTRSSLVWTKQMQKRITHYITEESRHGASGAHQTKNAFSDLMTERLISSEIYEEKQKKGGWGDVIPQISYRLLKKKSIPAVCNPTRAVITTVTSRLLLHINITWPDRVKMNVAVFLPTLEMIHLDKNWAV